MSRYRENRGRQTIHWHGVENPIEMDGMPFISQPIVEPGDKKFFAKNSAVGVELYSTAVQAHAKSDR